MIGKNITIIGGSGGMGVAFTKYFNNHDFNVTLTARTEKKLKQVAEELNVNYELDLRKSVQNADIVLVSVPIKSTPDVIREVAPFMKENSLIFDICSLKSSIFLALDEVRHKFNINSLSLHPMFGPGIKNMKNYVIIVVKVGGTLHYESIVNDLLDMFKSDGIILTETDRKTHDLKVALTLGVPHMFNILFLNLLKRVNEPLSELTRFTGTTFLLQKVFAESIIQREMEMFGDIQMENPEFLKVLDIFENLIKEYKSIIKNKNSDGFEAIFTDGLKFSKEDGHFKNSYKYFYEFMEILKR